MPNSHPPKTPCRVGTHALLCFLVLTRIWHSPLASFQPRSKTGFTNKDRQETLKEICREAIALASRHLPANHPALEAASETFQSILARSNRRGKKSTGAAGGESNHFPILPILRELYPSCLC